ncbi:Crp/Fnr family transcriptional regulator [Sphingomonas sp.]|uniref:Crp/Fnr family transcriptional regulator n=1 Tax=Sphingomonas sp. TaxID=28214 RepID=UPI0025E87C61|nr:Crp/Fnr family transcriptional regulator [Sphingomonas sp.]
MDQAAAFSVLTRENWIGAMPVEVHDAITARMHRLDVPAGAPIARAGDPCNRMFQVETGYVRLSRLHVDGSEALITIYISGNCYAETALVAHRPYNHSSSALVDCRLRVLEAEDFWDLYHRYPAIPEALCRKFAGAITRQISSREARATMKLGQRIAMMFFNFATDCAAATRGNDVTIGFPITQQDIATLFDVTRQSVHRELVELRGLGLIDKVSGQWIVHDRERLRRYFMPM